MLEGVGNNPLGCRFSYLGLSFGSRHGAGRVNGWGSMTLHPKAEYEPPILFLPCQSLRERPMVLARCEP